MTTSDAADTTRVLMDDADAVSRLRDALRGSGYTVDGCLDTLGSLAYSALSRGEIVPAMRQLRQLGHAGDTPVATLIKLFLLQEAVPAGTAADALPLADALAGGLLTRDAGGSPDTVRACVDIRPYGEADVDWWLVSDLGTGVLVGPGRNRRLHPDYVLGVGGASTTLAQLTVREEFGSALDLGTGCGVQALHLARHCRTVTGTDRNRRALDFARLTLELSLEGNGADAIDLREGDLFEPVENERFDLIVSNPPFVISPESAYSGGRYTYRDSGLPGDELCRRLVTQAPRHLNEGGWCQILANWLHVEGVDWRERVAGMVVPTGCDAWVVQREVQDPAEYAELWLRDSGDYGTSDERLTHYHARYEAWLDYFAANRIEAIGFGWITLHASGSADPYVRLEEVTHAVEQPLGAVVPDWFARHDVLRESDDGALLASRPIVGSDVRLEQIARPSFGGEGWKPESRRVRQTGGLRRSGDIDPVGAAVLGAADGGRTLGEILDGVAAGYGLDAAGLREGALDAVRGLVEEGFLTVG